MERVHGLIEMDWRGLKRGRLKWTEAVGGRIDGADGWERVCAGMLLLLIGGRIVLACWPIVLLVVVVVLVFCRVVLAFVSICLGIARGRRCSLCPKRTFRSRG